MIEGFRYHKKTVSSTWLLTGKALQFFTVLLPSYIHSEGVSVFVPSFRPLRCENCYC